MAIFYISDTHFGHKNILKYDNRPYFTVAEMDADLIKRWNNAVKPTDTVYHLGDFSWLKPVEESEILQQLNGTKILIRGNHDYKPTAEWADIMPYAEIDDNGRRVVLSHFPIAAFKNMEHGWFHLYGHIHNTFDDGLFEAYRDAWEKQKQKKMMSCNVGCMQPYMDYTPRTLDEIIGFRRWA